MSHRIFLVRHGETLWSRSGQHTSHTDLALTERGEDEARGLAALLQGVVFHTVLTSPRLRARQTCERAALSAQAAVEPDLREWEYGDFEGRRTIEIQMAQPHWNIFIDGCPGGEMPQDIARRADQLISRISTLAGDVALFTHGHFARSLAMRWIGAEIGTAGRFPLDTASVSILGIDAGHGMTRVIRAWNVTTRSFAPQAAAAP